MQYVKKKMMKILMRSKKLYFLKTKHLVDFCFEIKRILAWEFFIGKFKKL